MTRRISGLYAKQDGRGWAKIAMRSGSDAKCATWFTWNTEVSWRQRGDKTISIVLAVTHGCTPEKTVITGYRTRQRTHETIWHSREVHVIDCCCWLFVVFLSFCVHSFMAAVDLCVTTVAHFHDCLPQLSWSQCSGGSIASTKIGGISSSTRIGLIFLSSAVLCRGLFRSCFGPSASNKKLKNIKNNKMKQKGKLAEGWNNRSIFIPKKVAVVTHQSQWQSHKGKHPTTHQPPSVMNQAIGPYWRSKNLDDLTSGSWQIRMRQHNRKGPLLSFWQSWFRWTKP